VKAPRVTNVLRTAGLIDTTWYTEEARERGTAVHAATAYLDEGKLDETALDPRIVPYLDAYRAWKRGMAPRILAIEIEVVGRGYVGHPDRVAEIDGSIWIVDLKSSASEEDWHGVQLAAYAHAYKYHCNEPGLPRRANLYLLESGRYRFRERTDWRDWVRFRQALEAALRAGSAAP